MINIIKKELQYFIDDVKKNNCNIDEAKDKIQKDSILFDFFNHGEFECLTLNEKTRYKRIILNSWPLKNKDKPIASNINIVVILCQSSKNDLFFLIQEVYLNDKKWKQTDKLNELLYDFYTDQLQYITRNNAYIFKLMMANSYYKYKPDSNIESYNNIMTLKDLIKGKTKYTISKLITNEDLKNKVLLRIEIPANNKKLSISDFINNFKKEELNDLSQHMKEEQKIQTFIKRISSKKHRYLFSDTSYEYVREIIRQDISISKFRSSFSNRISTYKSSKELELSLHKYLRIISGWSKEIWVTKLTELNLKYNEVSNNVLIFEVDDFNTLKQIGSTQWCIATTEKNFNTYLKEDTGRRQIIIYDFNREINDSLSIIGVTLNNYSSPIHAHDKNNNDILHHNILNNINFNTRL
jgi:hypothetical protein